MVTATPYARIENVPIQSGLSSNFDTITLSDFTITYGRSTVLDQPAPARLRISFLVRQESPFLRRSLAESGIQVWVKYGSGQERRQFIGRIRDAEMSYAQHLDGLPLFRLDISASDTMADLEKWNVWGMDRGTESARSRLDFLQDRARGIVDGIGGPAFPYTLAPKKSDGTLLSEITAIFNSGGEGLWYDPHTHRVEAAGRVAYSGFGLTLLKTGASRYSLSWRGSGTSIIRPRQHRARAASGIQHATDQVITSVRATGKQINPGNQWVDGDYGRALSGGNGWGQLTIVSEGYATYDGTTYNPWGLQATADFWATLVTDSRTPPHPPITTEHTDFDTEGDLVDLLQCRESRLGNYIPSIYTSSVPYLMIQRAIGGTVNYKADTAGPGTWTVERVWANVPVTDLPAPVTGKTINPNTSQIVRFRDLDETVTGAALRWTTKGV